MYWDASNKDRYSIVGVGLGYCPIKEILYVNAKWWTNYAIKQHFKVNYFEVQLVWVSGILQGASDKK